MADAAKEAFDIAIRALGSTTQTLAYILQFAAEVSNSAKEKESAKQLLDDVMSGKYSAEDMMLYQVNDNLADKLCTKLEINNEFGNNYIPYQRLVDDKGHYSILIRKNNVKTVSAMEEELCRNSTGYVRATSISELAATDFAAKGMWEMDLSELEYEILQNKLAGRSISAPLGINRMYNDDGTVDHCKVGMVAAHFKNENKYEQGKDIIEALYNTVLSCSGFYKEARKKEQEYDKKQEDLIHKHITLLESKKTKEALYITSGLTKNNDNPDFKFASDYWRIDNTGASLFRIETRYLHDENGEIKKDENGNPLCNYYPIQVRNYPLDDRLRSKMIQELQGINTMVVTKDESEAKKIALFGDKKSVKERGFRTEQEKIVSMQYDILAKTVSDILQREYEKKGFSFTAIGQHGKDNILKKVAEKEKKYEDNRISEINECQKKNISLEEIARIDEYWKDRIRNAVNEVPHAYVAKRAGEQEVNIPVSNELFDTACQINRELMGLNEGKNKYVSELDRLILEEKLDRCNKYEVKVNILKDTGQRESLMNVTRRFEEITESYYKVPEVERFAEKNRKKTQHEIER